MLVSAHATLAFRREGSKFRSKFAVFVKQFFRLVAPEPFFQHSQVLRILCRLRQRNLMRTKRPLDGLAVDELWSGPTLRRAQHDHGPLRAFCLITVTCACLN